MTTVGIGRYSSTVTLMGDGHSGDARAGRGIDGASCPCRLRVAGRHTGAGT
jgi:hypothetical protein